VLVDCGHRERLNISNCYSCDCVNLLKQIPVLVDLPVGRNLQDHVTVVGMEYLLTEKIGSSEKKAKSLSALFDYFVFGKGKFRASNNN